ncbi:MAG: MATE family efflux transporter [Blautia sp.]|nr:MATE family efflux transporter [Blautia sp.]
MTEGAMLPKLITFAVPLLLSSILQLLFNAVDVIVVGRFAGKLALAAVGSTTALINLFINLFMGISMGTSVLAAHTYAARDYKHMSETVHTSILMALCSGCLMVFVGAFFSRPALFLMGTPEDVIGLSALYMRIYFCGMPFFMLYNYGAAILRAVGDTARPLFYLTISGVVNALLNLLLVTVFHLGVAGVAIATVISQCISCVLVLRCLILTDGPYKLDFRRLHINKYCLKQICVVGIPSGIQTCVISFSNVCLQSSVNSFGSVAMAGYTAANNLMGFLYVSVNANSQAALNFASQNLGARKLRRIDRLLVECLGLQVAVALSLGGMGYLFGDQLLHVYTDDKAVIAAGMQVIAITFVPYFICGFMDLFAGLMRGLGHAFVPMVLSLLGTVGLRLLWIYFYFPHHRTLFDLFLSYPISWMGTFLMQAISYFFVRRGIWRKYGMFTENGGGTKRKE